LATLEELITPEDEEDALSYLLTEADAVGFPTTAWQTGGVAYTLLRIVAKALTDKVALVAEVARGGLLALASGAWLTLLALSHYDVTRYVATRAAGSVTIAIASGSPGQTIQPGQLWIRTAAGLRYNSTNAAPVVIASGGSATIPFHAEATGSAYNVALGTGLTLVTPLAGLTAAFLDVGTGTWLTTQGADEETDALVRARCQARWATIGVQKTSDAYYALARDSASGTTTVPNRVTVDASNPRGPGTVDVWIAGPAGPLSAPDEAAVSTYVTDRASPCTDVACANATSLPVTVTATLYYTAQYTSAPSEAAANVTALIQALPIAGTLRVNEVIEQLMAPTGVYDLALLTLNGGAVNLTLGAAEVATVAAVTLTLVATP